MLVKYLLDGIDTYGDKISGINDILNNLHYKIATI